eukprot:gene13444-17160_t
MGATDVERQKPNVFRMNLLGAEVRPVTSGTGTLKDAMNEAMRDWVTNVEDTYYLIGTAAGPHPYPAMVRDFQSIIGHEAREQILSQEGRLPDAVVACIGGGSNAIGGLGYVACVQEMQVQWLDMGFSPDAVVVGSGSSGTHGGMVAGFLGNNIKVPLIGVGVSRDPADQEPLVLKEAQAVVDLLGLDIK